VDAFIDRKRQQQERALSQALASVRGTLRSVRTADPDPTTPVGDSARVARQLELEAHAERLTLALALIPEQVARVGPVDAIVERRGLSPSLALAGGAAAGLALGLLLALLLVRFDPRVRSATDLDIPGMRIVEIASGQSASSMQRLRSELEVAGLGRDHSVLVVTAATRAESRTGVALGLAEAFAAAGTQTALLSADLGAPVDGENVVPLLKSGVSTFLDGSDQQLAAAEVARDLVWVPKGESETGVELRISSAQVDQLLGEARELGHVVVIDAPPVLDSGGLLFVAATDLTLMVVQKTRTKWSALNAGLERLLAARRGPVQICFDRSSGRVGRAEPGQGTTPDHVAFSSSGAAGP
jgi:Mrp family chromosome partitioning ATPase